MAYRHNDALAECDLEGNVVRVAGGGRVMGRQKEFVLSSVRDAGGRAVLDANEARRLVGNAQGPTPNPHYQPTPAARMAAFRRDVNTVAVAYEQATTRKERARAAAAAGSATDSIEVQKHELTQALAVALAAAGSSSRNDEGAALSSLAGTSGEGDAEARSAVATAAPATAGARRSRSPGLAAATATSVAPAQTSALPTPELPSAHVATSAAPHKSRRPRGSLLDDLLP